MMTFFPGATCLGGGSNHFGFITKCTVGCHFEFKCVGSVNFFLVLAVALFGLPFKLLSLFGSCLFPIPEPLNREGGVSLIVSLGSSVLPIAFSLFLTQVLHEASPFALPPPFSLAILEWSEFLRESLDKVVALDFGWVLEVVVTPTALRLLTWLNLPLILENVNCNAFLCGFTLPPSLNSEIRRCALLLGEPLGLQGKEVVFLEIVRDGVGFKPRT